MTLKQEKLVEENHNLIFSFLKKYKLDIDDFYDLAAIGLCKAVLNYSDKISNFSTYAYTCMYTEVMMELRKNSQKKTIPKEKILYYNAETSNNDDTTEYINFIPAKENVEEDVISNVIFNLFRNSLHEKSKYIFDLLVNEYSIKEIAEITGTSKQNVSRVRINMKNKFHKEVK